MRTIVDPAGQATRAKRHERRQERRRLQRVDRLSARLAELHAIRALLERGADVIGSGWVQDAWFTVAMATAERRVTAYEVRRTENRPVTRACLVGAVIHAAGGPSTVRSQLVQRTLDVAWHALREEPDQPVRWCPGPEVRTMHVGDLTRWNDAPGRTKDDVVDLLVVAQQTTDIERDRCLADLAALGGTHRALP